MFFCISSFIFLYSCFPPSTFLQSLGAFLIYLFFHIFIIQPSTSSYYLTLFLFLLLLLLPFPLFYFPTNSSFFLLNSFSIFLILPHSLSVFFYLSTTLHPFLRHLPTSPITVYYPYSLCFARLFPAIPLSTMPGLCAIRYLFFSVLIPLFLSCIPKGRYTPRSRKKGHFCEFFLRKTI